MNCTHLAIPQNRAWIEIDCTSLKHNLQLLKSYLPQNCSIMPVIKANAYGHGDIIIANELAKLNINSFCVATVDEGIKLRQNGIMGEILILGYTSPTCFDLLKMWDLTQTAIDFNHAKELDSCGKSIKVHIAVDSGMYRLGESCGNFDKIKAIFTMNNINITGLFTHLCVANSPSECDRDFTMTQYNAFSQLVNHLKSFGIKIPKTHILNSSGVLNYPELLGDYARVGIALYGVSGSVDDHQSHSTDFSPVLSLKCRVALVKNLPAHKSVGYGLDFTAKRDSKIAVITIGYADGLPRALSCGVGNVLINGVRVPIIGRVCMDQTLVDVTEVGDIKSGDIVTIIGKCGNEKISVCDIAKQTNTITNDILSGLGERLHRIAVN